MTETASTNGLVNVARNEDPLDRIKNLQGQIAGLQSNINCQARTLKELREDYEFTATAVGECHRFLDQAGVDKLTHHDSGFRRPATLIERIALLRDQAVKANELFEKSDAEAERLRQQVGELRVGFAYWQSAAEVSRKNAYELSKSVAKLERKLAKIAKRKARR